MRYRSARPLHLLLGAVISCLVFGCSNSEGIDCAGAEIIAVVENSNNHIEKIVPPQESSSSEKHEESSSAKVIDYLPIDDSESPYAGIPRIVIETENYRQIRDRETEFPAKLQIWGERAPESEIMELTIRGRGNSTWWYPKKPYAIKFNKKQAFLGMPAAKKWVMLANYRDRTLIRNAVAFELARKTSLAWTPSGKFVDVYLNRRFIGNYYICEKIEVNDNRLELDEDSYLLEFDAHYDEEYKFKSTYNDLPVNIKYPKEPDSVQIERIKNFIDSAEQAFGANANDSCFLDYVEATSFADYFIIYALATNGELEHPKSLFVYKDGNKKLSAGPVWDFDFDTFNINKLGFSNRNGIFVEQFLRKKSFHKTLQERWSTTQRGFLEIYSFIDSLSSYLEKSNSLNTKIWPIKIDKYNVGDEHKSFEEAVKMLKGALSSQYSELDNLIGPAGELQKLYEF